MITTSSAIPIGSGVREIETWSPLSADLASEFEYIDIAAIDREQKVITATARTRASDAPSRARQIVQKGDVLVSTVRPALNSVAVIPPSLDGAIASTGFTVLRSDERRLHGPYLFHWVRGNAFIDEMVRLATGASYPAVSDRIVKGSTIPIPFPDDPRRSLAEQKRIAAILDMADAIRRHRQEAARLADTLIPSVFYEMFGDPGTNPKRLPTIELGSLTTLVTSGLTPSGGSAVYVNHGPYFIRSQNVRMNRLDLSDVACLPADIHESMGRTKVAVGDVLLNITGASIGRVAWVESLDREANVNQHVCVIRLDTERASPEYLSVCLSLPWGQELIMRTQSGASRQGLNHQQVRLLRIPYPDSRLQREFTERIRQVRALQQSYEAHELATKELFNSIVQRAFRGEL